MVQKTHMFIENDSDETLFVWIEYIAYQVILEPGQDLRIEVEAPPEVSLLSLFDMKYLSGTVVVYVKNDINMFGKYKVSLFEKDALSFTCTL